MKTKNQMLTGIFVGALMILAVVALTGGFSQKAVGTPQEDIDLGIACGDNPAYIDNATFNEYSRGTGVAVTYSYTIKDKVTNALTLTPGSSGTDFDVGDEVTILSSVSGYIDRIDTITIAKCGKNIFTNYISEADAITIDILDDRSNEVTDVATTASAVNITDGGAETSANFIVEVKGVRDKTTGQVLLTLELNDTEVDTLSISAKSAGAKVIDDSADTDLTLFSAEGTSPSVKFAFIVDEVKDGGAEEYLFTATAESGEALGAGDATGFLYVNAYAGQYFIDTDGSIQFGWEDKDGAVKYEQKSGDHDALFS